MGTTAPTRPRAPARAAPIVLLVLAWASTFAAIKIGVDHCPPLLFAGLRALLGGVALAPLVLWRAGPTDRPRPVWPTYAMLAILNVVGFLGLQTLSLSYLPTGMAAVLIYLQPVLVGMLAWPVLGERLSASKVIGLILGFAGVVTVSAGSLRADVSALGVLLALGSALTWALGTVYLKRRQHVVAYGRAMAAQFLIGGSVLTGAGLLLEDPLAVDPTPSFWLGLGYAGLVGSALAWALWSWLVGVGEASTASTYIFSVPIVAIAIGWVLFDEPVTPLLALGAGLVVAGTYLVNRRRPV